jgi:hypothetical protein
LGTPSPSNEPEPDAQATPAGYAPPFLPPDEPAEVLPAAESVVRAAEADSIVPAPERSGAELKAPIVAESVDDRESPKLPTPTAEEAAGRAPRLARGLASFSRDNADRERKFRHILSDEGAGKSKKP